MPAADVDDELIGLAHTVAEENGQFWVPVSEEVQRCARCGRLPDHVVGQWIATWDAGELVGSVCPDCSTSEDYTEAAVADATVDHSLDESGRLMGTPKGEADE